jgi:hypothetical protein
MSETADDLVKSPAYFRLDYWECAGGKGRWGIGVAADILAIEARLNALESSSPVQSAQKTAAAVANDPVREGEPVASEGPGDGYRWVLATGPDGPGEVHEKGDECPDCLGIWRPVRHVIGRVCDEPGIYRRRITPAESVPDDAAMRILDEATDIDDLVRRLHRAQHDAICRLVVERDTALAEVERHRMTSEERNAVTVAAAVASPPAPFPSASVQYDDGRRVPVSVYAESLRGYLHRTKEGE